MVRLNGVEFNYRQGMSLAELVDDYNTTRKKIAFDGFVVIINDNAVASLQAPERILNDDDTIAMIPHLDGG